ncbi:hydroxypyruvate isomerase family protein [Ruegeria arenilitoris]|uniref:hydroxypyruvate isomerase family protein n=1 Tax=Ruegeria arenilitoris TaxID=1173585 RepID=UPI0014810AA5|nr:TIM barrel protein [Ruegeria arenilitoris]
MRFSANLGFLWKELPLPEAIRAAGAVGFDAVECHWPYETPAAEVVKALDQTGLRMLSQNTGRGDSSRGENGLSALPGREGEARVLIDQAIEYATAIGAANIHVMAGNANGPTANATFVDNLRYAAAMARVHDITILIEPLNRYDAPGYFLKTTSHAIRIIEEVGASNLKLMFDCYHVQIMEGDLSRRLSALLPLIGHIQIASVPDRHEPGSGEIDYGYLLKFLDRVGWAGWVGCEYMPLATTDDGLVWIENLRRKLGG